MPKQDFLTLLQSATESEFKYLRWFLQSNYYVTDKNLLTLYEAVFNYHPSFASKAISKERLFEKVFPGQNFDDGKWRNLASKMKKAVETYFIQLELEEDKLLQKRLLSKSLGKRNQFNRMKKNILATSSTLEDKPARQVDENYELYRLYREVIFRPESKQRLPELDELLQKTAVNLDLFYALERQRLELIIYSLLNTTGNSNSQKHLKPSFDFPENPLFNLFFKLRRLLESGNNKLFFEVKNMLIASVNLLTKIDCQIVIPLLINYGIEESNKDEKTFMPEIFELYKLGLEQEVLLVGDKLTDATFLNIVSSGILMKQFEWVANFLEQYKNGLNKSSKGSVLTLAWAKLHFGRKDFSSAAKELSTFEFNSISHKRNARILLLRSHFELYLQDSSYLELLKSEQSAFEKYLKRAKHLSESSLNSCLNMVDFLKKLTTASTEIPFSLAKSEKLVSQLEEYSLIIARNWFMEKIKELSVKKNPVE